MNTRNTRRDVRKEYASFMRSLIHNSVNNSTVVTRVKHTVFQDAILVNASYEHNRTKAYAKTQEFISTSSSIGGWRVRPQSSDSESIVTFNDYTKEVVVAFRGSSQSGDDWACVKSIFNGSYLKNEQFYNAFQKVKSVQHIVPQGYKLKLLGYSMGGGKAIVVGEALNIPSTTFNPFLPITNVHHIRGSASQQIHRVVNDPFTFHSLIPFKNRAFIHVMPLQDDAQFLARVQSPHSLGQFTRFQSTSRPRMSLEQLQTHYKTHTTFNNNLDRAVDVKYLVNARKAVLRKQPFTEYVLNVHQKSIRAIGKRLVIHPDIPPKAIHAFKAVGGDVLSQEAAAISAFKPTTWSIDPNTIANETSIAQLTSVQDYHETQVLHYEQEMLTTRTDMGKLLGEHGTFLGFALLGAYLGYMQGNSNSEKVYRSSIGAVEGTLPWINISDFLDNMGINMLPQEKQEIHKLLFGNKPGIHFDDLTKHDPVSNLLLDILPWGMERRKEDYELSMQQLNSFEDEIAEAQPAVIDTRKYESRSENTPTIINRRTGIKYHLVSNP